MDAGISLAETRQERLDGVDDLDRVGPGLALDRQDDGARIAVDQLATLSFSTLSMTVAELAQVDRRAVAVGDDQGPVGLGVG